MAYKQQDFKNGKVLFAEPLNEMDKQIVANEQAITNIIVEINTLKTSVNEIDALIGGGT